MVCWTISRNGIRRSIEGHAAYHRRRQNTDILIFIGLDLYDEHSVPVEGRGVFADADRMLTEFYTSHLVSATVEELEVYHDIDIEVHDHTGVEQDLGSIFGTTEDEHVVLLIAGDTTILTVYVDLRLRVESHDIGTYFIHGVTVQSATSGLIGFQNYRFGKAVTLPLPYIHDGDPVPESAADSLEASRNLGLHTLVYLDIKVDWEGRRNVEADDDQYMTVDYAAELFAEHWDVGTPGVAVCQAGSPGLIIAADRLSVLAEHDFGAPLHMLVILDEVHHAEADTLPAFGSTPEELFNNED